MLRLGIDASNLREGGGTTHLVELLEAVEPGEHGIDQIMVWGAQKTLGCLPPKTWLIPQTDHLLDQSLPARIYWQKFKLSKEAQQNCDILFVPGGSYTASFRPYVSMNQNMLPFEKREYLRFGVSWMTLKMALLRFSQTATFRGADGTIYLTEYARAVVQEQVKPWMGEYVTIPHGINPVFRLAPRPALPIDCYSQTSPFRLLYVSTIFPYKHQWSVTKAVHELRQKGFWVELDLVGSAYLPSLHRFQKVVRQIDPDGNFIHYHGVIPYSELHLWYHRADGFIFASSCESFSLTLLEAMASGLPIACSNRGPMPEILGEAGFYFDPERIESITQALDCMIRDSVSRENHARLAYTRAQIYSWERCARETLNFIAYIARKEGVF